jgi:3-oxoadipate enol-lactonase
MLLVLADRHIHFDLLGNGDGPVVALAHALSADMGVWAEQVPLLLAEGWRVLRFDMRGHGGSSAGPGTAYAMGELAGDVIAVLDHLEISKVHFAGLSIGGMIGQVLGLDHAGRLHSLMLSDTAPATIPGGRPLWDERFAAIRAARSVEPLADATLGRWLTPAFCAANPQRAAQIRATVATTTVAGYIGGGQAIFEFDVRARLGSLRVPTLVVWGDEDPGTPPAGNAFIADHVPGAKRHVFAGARHVPMVECSVAFSRVMKAWLSSQREGAQHIGSRSRRASPGASPQAQRVLGG